MFMHPLVFLFTLGWLVSIGYGMWGELDVSSPSSYIPLLTMIFGLLLSMGGFFVEALKARHALFAAVFDSSISAAAQPVVPQTDASLLYSDYGHASRLLHAQPQLGPLQSSSVSTLASL